MNVDDLQEFFEENAPIDFFTSLVFKPDYYVLPKDQKLIYTWEAATVAATACLQCGKPVTSKKGGRRKFCSKACNNHHFSFTSKRKTSRLPRVPHPCPQCQTEVPARRVYCSRKCCVKFLNDARNLRTSVDRRTPKQPKEPHVKKPNLRGVHLRKPDGTRLPVLPVSRRNP